ncbi:MAG TPA: hypothetical protein PLQ76_02230 [bacterium]|nr:hypothetical protein [bacterium]
MTEKYLLFIALCLLNPTIENIGLGFQKMGIDRGAKAKSKGEKALWTFVWIFGFILSVSVAFIAFKILTLGNASTAGAFAGFGLVALTLFSYFILKETILKQELAGIALIMIATSILGYFSHGSQSETAHVNSTNMIYFFVGYLILIGIGGAILTKRLKTLGGLILGLIAGSMAGVGYGLQKIVSPMFMELFKNFNGENLGKIATEPINWIMVLCAIGGVVILQFAYKYGKAVQVVPTRAAAFIMTPLISGLVYLGEKVPVICLASIVLVILGVVVTTTANPAKHGH